MLVQIGSVEIRHPPSILQEGSWVLGVGFCLTPNTRDIKIRGAVLFTPQILRRGENKRPACSHEPAGRPVDCLGLTKRWSLYVASHGNSRVGSKPSRDLRDASVPTHRLVCGL